jgi:sulfite reductase beta subunit-like hemoprotein
VPGGVLSAEQAQKVADIADRFAGGGIHITTRASIEFHGVQGDALPDIGRMLAAVGLTTRGACGGAVRGVVCSTPFLEGFAATQVLARKLHRHFTGNPNFEGLPKKFKIGVDAGYEGSRHLIQDIGLVRAGTDGEQDRYDIWMAGGLGREPHPAFLFERGVAEERLIPLIEAVVTIYRRHTPQGKRLKHLVRERGEAGLRETLGEELAGKAALFLADGFARHLTPPAPAAGATRLEAGVFAGELTTAALRRMAEIASDHAGGFMVLTGDQNVAFFVQAEARDEAAQALAAAGFTGASREERTNFRVCPGSHECRMGLAPTRDIARSVLAAMGLACERLAWAIAGCPNSCAQPQLAGAGIVTAKLVKGEDGERHPRFDLYRRSEADAFGIPTRQGLTLAELVETVREIG